jgi:ABC-type multidrug transport system fused ATPase/permease subunit
MAGASIFTIFSYASPILSALCFAVFSIRAAFDFTTKIQPQRKRWRVVALTVNFALVVTYMAQASLELAAGPNFNRDGHIHILSELLLWTAMGLSLSGGRHAIPKAYMVTALLTLVLETTFTALQFAKHNPCWPTLLCQLLALSLLGAMSLLSLIARTQRVSKGDDADERTPLLGPTSEAQHGSDSDSAELATRVSVGDDDKSSRSSDSDDDDDEEMKEVQRKRLESSGGLIAYLKDFTIFLPYLWPGRDLRMLSYIVLILVNLLIIRILNVVEPFLLGMIVNKLTMEKAIPWLELALWAIFGVLASEGTGLGAMNGVLDQRVTTWSMQKLKLAGFDHIMQLSMDFHDDKDSGEIIKALEQAGSLTGVLKVLVMDIIPGVMDVFVAFWFVAYLLDGYAVLIVIAVAIAFVFLTTWITSFLKTSNRDVAARERDQSRLIYETVSNWSVVQYFNRRGFEKARLAGILKGAADAGIYNNDLYIALYGAQEFCEKAGEIAIVILAAYRIVNGLAPVGTFVAITSYWQTLMMPLWIVGHSYQQLTTDLISAERLLQLFTSVPSVKDVDGAKSLEANRGGVEFDDVCYGYHEDKLALDHVSFQVRPGQKVGLVGETGSGKSTTLKLLMRFYDITSGKIMIDGQDIQYCTQDSLREVFGVVPQDTVLFNTTVLENVRYARLDATDEDVFEACKAAAIHDKILTFPRGYHTKVGECGVKLSGGEMQRISIARVILKRPRIVLLDEATSAIDTITESKIQTALRNLTQDRTTFMIAHRLSTIRDADIVLVVDQGRIVERGTHEELLKDATRYKELWAQQSSALREEKQDEKDSESDEDEDLLE